MSNHSHYAVSPGDVILLEMDARKMRRTDLSAKSGISVKKITDIITGRSAITPSMAPKLTSALGMNDRYWLNLECHYQENLSRGRWRKQKENIQLGIVVTVIAAFMLAAYVKLI